MSLLLFVQTGSNQTRPQPSVRCFSSESNSFHLQNTHIQNLYGSHDEFSHMLRSPSPPPYAPPVDPEIRSSLSPAARRLFCSALPSSFLSPRTLRSFKLFIPLLEPSSSTFSPMLYHYPLFRFSLSPLSGLLFYSLSMHMFHTHPLL